MKRKYYKDGYNKYLADLRNADRRDGKTNALIAEYIQTKEATNWSDEYLSDWFDVLKQIYDYYRLITPVSDKEMIINAQDFGYKEDEAEEFLKHFLAIKKERISLYKKEKLRNYMLMGD
jgi:hypothetical protein